jgi:hypothetical protein
VKTVIFLLALTGEFFIFLRDDEVYMGTLPSWSNLINRLVKVAVSRLDSGGQSWVGSKQVICTSSSVRKKIQFEEPGNQDADIPSFQNKTM